MLQGIVRIRQVTGGAGFMDPEFVDTLEHEIERLRRRYAVLFRELPATRELPARWTFGRGALCWIVPLDEEDEVLEPDIDVEITSEILVVRARPQADEHLTLLGLLPVPPNFDIGNPRIRYEEGFLEIRVRLLDSRGRSR
jgi:hypothetical protein